MLRVAMATLGIALIAFGLFGGERLEQVHASLNGLVEKYGPGAGEQHNLADSSTVQSADQTTAVSAASAGTNDAVVKTTQSAQTEISETNIGGKITAAVIEPEPEPEPEAQIVSKSETGSIERKTSVAASLPKVVEDATVAEKVDAQVDSTSVSASVGATAITSSDASIGEKVDLASVENAANDDSSLKEVKASARNIELELALNGTAVEVPTDASLPKEAVVGEILQTTTGSVAVDALFVLKDQVNLREGPSIDHSVVLRLSKGQELMEFKREGKWVHVGAYGTAGKIGWVHERLVGK